MVKAPRHPRRNRTGMVPQHRLVMESVIGRVLDPLEVVHHINMIETDNRPENLHLFQKNQPHLAAHGSLNRCVARLIEAGVLVFDRDSETYRVAELTQQVGVAA